jgi:RNA polymerase sigma-70 factor (ECF subfamily)
VSKVQERQWSAPADPAAATATDRRGTTATTVREVHESVVDAARRGDPDAFAAILRHYDGRLRALAYRIVGRGDMMDDVVQEASIKAFRALPEFAGRSALSTWLLRIVYTTALNALRSERNLRSRPVDPQELEATSGPDPADELPQRQAVVDALASLPPDQRAVVWLILQQGYDHATAGEILGIPPGTVASRLHHARARLRQALGAPEAGATLATSTSSEGTP